MLARNYEDEDRNMELSSEQKIKLRCGIISLTNGLSNPMAYKAEDHAIFYDFLESLLLHYPSLNLDWLLTGRGRMYRENKQEESSETDQLPLFPLPSPAEPRRIDRILVFYDDNTYQEFRTKE